MKRRIFSLLFVVFACIFFLCKPVLAVPMLQLDILGGIYDLSTETTVATGPLFTVRALLKDNALLGTDFYLSVALLPSVGTQDPNIDVGFFKLGSDVIHVVNDMNYGSPPVDTDYKDIQSHGIFPTYYTEFAFRFDSTPTTPAYNTQDYTPASGNLYYRDFAFNVSGLDFPNIIHFDLYHLSDTKNKIDYFAPFSHDAESASFPVPEPATMLLLGSGLVGLAGFRRKWRQK